MRTPVISNRMTGSSSPLKGASLADCNLPSTLEEQSTGTGCVHVHGPTSSPEYFFVSCTGSQGSSVRAASGLVR